MITTIIEITMHRTVVVELSSLVQHESTIFRIFGKAGKAGTLAGWQPG